MRAERGNNQMKTISKALLGAGATMAIGVGGAFAGLIPASAAVSRNEISTLQYTVTVAGTYTHSYTVTPDPCGPDFTATGQYPAAPAPAQYDEVLNGVVGGTPAAGVSLNYTGTYYYPGTTTATGYTYTFTGAFTDSAGDFVGTVSDNAGNSDLPTTGTITGATSTNYNHGQYVSSTGPSAAHSCVGMPSQSQK